MSSRTKALLGLAVAVATLWTLVGAAHASRLAFGNELGTGAWRAVWREMTYSIGAETGRCALTLEGSFHSLTITKTRGALIGYVTGATASNCISGSATVLTAGLPWQVQYQGFNGVLPTINSMALRILGFGLRITDSTSRILCLVRSIEEPEEETELFMALTRRSDAVIQSATLSGRLPGCFTPLTFGGTTTSFGTPSPTRSITLTLV